MYLLNDPFRYRRVLFKENKITVFVEQNMNCVKLRSQQIWCCDENTAFSIHLQRDPVWYICNDLQLYRRLL